jgi:DNA-binding CsgD family transcriptional regulator
MSEGWHNKVPRKFGLSGRQTEILKLMSEGKQDLEIAAILGISENTVQAQYKNIKEWLGAANRPHAVRIALTKGMID